MKGLLRKSVTPQNLTKISVAVIFSLIAIVGGFSDMAYVPLSGTKIIDITIVAVMFASLIGGYRLTILLAIIWSAVTYCNVDHDLITWPLWAIALMREVFGLFTVWVYTKLKEVHRGSPYNVYRAVLYSILFKNIVAIPFDIYYRGAGWFTLRCEQFVIEFGLCTVFMILLIKHLRQIHILNGVRKKGEKQNAN